MGADKENGLGRLATACVLTVICATLIFAQHPAPASAGQAPVSVAEGVGVRALTLDARTSVYLTAANAPDRVFALAATGPMGSLAAAAKLEKVAGSGENGSLGDGGSGLDAQLALKTDSLVMRSGIAVAPDGTIFIADTFNSTVRRIGGALSTEPGVIRSVAGRWAPRQNVLLAEPIGLALDRAGDLFITDHGTNTVDVLRAASSQTTELETIAQVIAPASIAVTRDGTKVFVASPETGGVFKIDVANRSIQQVAGFVPHAPSALADGNSNTALCGSTPTSTRESCPSGLAVDAGSNLFVADANADGVYRVDAATEKTTIAATGLNAPGEMAFDSDGDLYVADQGHNRILRYDGMGQSTPTLTIAAPGNANLYDFGTQATGGSTATAAFALTNNSPSDVIGLVFNTFTGNNTTDFTVVSSSCTISLAAGASCSINIAFTPQATGLRTASLSVTDSNPQDSATAAVQGTGDDFQIQAASGQLLSVAVVQGKSATFNLQVVSDPNDSLALFSSPVTPTCPPFSTLPKYTTCTISPTIATPAPGTPAPFTVTFQTTFNSPPPGTTSRAPSARLDTQPGPLHMNPLTVLNLCAGTLAAVALIYRRRRNAVGVPLTVSLRRAVPAFVLFILGATLVAGCKKTTNPKLVSTPTGSTTMILQATGQNAARTIQLTLSVDAAP